MILVSLLPKPCFDPHGKPAATWALDALYRAICNQSIVKPQRCTFDWSVISQPSQLKIFQRNVLCWTQPWRRCRRGGCDQPINQGNPPGCNLWLKKILKTKRFHKISANPPDYRKISEHSKSLNNSKNLGFQKIQNCVEKQAGGKCIAIKVFSPECTETERQHRTTFKWSGNDNKSVHCIEYIQNQTINP